MISWTRLQAEQDRMKVTHAQQMPNQQAAQNAGATMQQEKERQPHVIYHAYTGGQPPPAPPPPPAPQPTPVPLVNPADQMERYLREMLLQGERQRLHEVTAAVQKSVRQKISEMEGELKQAQEMARSSSAAAASQSSLKEQALSALMDSRKQVAALEVRGMDIFKQKQDNDLENGS